MFPTSGTLQFLTGASQQTLTLSVWADEIPEETEVCVDTCVCVCVSVCVVLKWVELEVFDLYLCDLSQ